MRVAIPLEGDAVFGVLCQSDSAPAMAGSGRHKGYVIHNLCGGAREQAGCNAGDAF